ncbi:hypothetical protein BDR07DRAFT_1380152 [Suillus spraguei]|nr:hypothetical protein BDR07DRAFT_1380152 [Suillus spraguei]
MSCLKVDPLAEGASPSSPRSCTATRADSHFDSWYLVSVNGTSRFHLVQIISRDIHGAMTMSTSGPLISLDTPTHGSTPLDESHSNGAHAIWHNQALTCTYEMGLGEASGTERRQIFKAAAREAKLLAPKIDKELLKQQKEKYRQWFHNHKKHKANAKLPMKLQKKWMAHRVIEEEQKANILQQIHEEIEEETRQKPGQKEVLRRYQPMMITYYSELSPYYTSERTCIISRMIRASGPWAHGRNILVDDRWAGRNIFPMTAGGPMQGICRVDEWADVMNIR